MVVIMVVIVIVVVVAVVAIVVLDHREAPHRLLRDRERPRARLLDEGRPDDPHHREDLVGGDRLELPCGRAEPARDAPRRDRLLDLLAGRATQRIERLELAVAADHVEAHHAGLGSEPEVEPDHLVAARRRVERIGRLAAAAGMLRREVAVLREQRCGSASSTDSRGWRWHSSRHAVHSSTAASRS